MLNNQYGTDINLAYSITMNSSLWRRRDATLRRRRQCSPFILHLCCQKFDLENFHPFLFIQYILAREISQGHYWIWADCYLPFEFPSALDLKLLDESKRFLLNNFLFKIFSFYFIFQKKKIFILIINFFLIKLFLFEGSR